MPDYGAPPPDPAAQPAYDPYAPGPPRSNAPAIVALVTGIIGLVLSWIPGINLLSVILAIVAVITGVIGLRNAALAGGRGMAVAGIITGVLGFLLALLILVGLANVVSDPAFRQELDRQLEEQQQEQG